MQDKIIEFVRQKDYKFIKEIGQGGTGRTVLLEDETINERFVCKKYSPFYSCHKPLFFNNFKDEIKLLHLLNHENIVRVFNYYLYPEHSLGYILMEYIEGKNISEYLAINPDKLNEVFNQVINGFTHLEQAGILHRDIRPDNILISDEGIVKIIDFGFSKKIDYDTDFQKSIELNWLYSTPSEFIEGKYNFQTEVYFIGKLFEDIINVNELSSFNYSDILSNMTKVDFTKRTKSFFDVKREVINALIPKNFCSDYEKDIYKNFANGLEKSIAHIYIESSYIDEISEIIRSIGTLYQNSILEDFVQNNGSLGKCFIKGNFAYNDYDILDVDTLRDFYNFLNESSKEKQKIIVNHIWHRLDKCKRFDTDIPF